jgi:hypothetical protein
MMKKRILVITMAIFILSGTCLDSAAGEFDLQAVVDRNKAEIDSPFNLSLIFSGAQDLDAPHLGDIEGFSWRHTGSSTRISVINGRRSSSISHNYVFIPLKTGILEIPVIKVRYRGKVYETIPISMEISDKGSYQRGAISASQDPEEIKSQDERIFLVINAGKRKAYAGEYIPVSISLYINNLAVRDIQYPQFAHKGFFMDKFSEPVQYNRVIDGINYDVVEFKVNAYGLVPGKLILGPAEIGCSLVYRRNPDKAIPSFFGRGIFNSDIFENFFGTYESEPVKIESRGFPIEILALPAGGRPRDFTGAVGDYAMLVKASPCEVNVGDPITLTIEIQGSGNLDTVMMPELVHEGSFRVYEPEVTQTEGKKIFQQIIMPLNDNIKEIPPVTFSFFDPGQGEYRTVTAGQIPIRVLALPEGQGFKIVSSAEMRAEDDVNDAEALGRDIVYIKESPGPLRDAIQPFCTSKLFFILLFLPPAMILADILLKRRHDRFTLDIGYARRCRALKTASKSLKKLKGIMHKGDKEVFFEHTIKTLKQYLGDRFCLSAGGITKDIVIELKGKGIDDGVIKGVEEIFNACDIARYAPSDIKTGAMPSVYNLLRSTINKMEKATV